MSAEPTFSIPFQSKESAALPQSKDGITTQFLNVPIHSPSPRRFSLTSTFSDVSDLEYMSNDHSVSLLRPTINNVSHASAYSNSGRVTFRQRLRDLYYQNYGALLVIIAQVFASGMNTSARALEQPGSHGAPMHPFQILFTRQLLTSILCTAYALMTKSIPYFPLGPPDTKLRLLLVIRGVMGFVGVYGMYFSLVYLPLSEATVLTFLAPILVCYICSLVLPNETFTRQQQLAGLVSFVGVIFIAQPTTLFNSFRTPQPSPGIDGDVVSKNATFSSQEDPLSNYNPLHPTPSQHLKAIGVAMIGVLGATLALTSIRVIGTRAHAFISVNYFSVCCTIVSLFALILSPDVSFRLPGNVTEWGLLLSLGVCGFIMQCFLTMGLSYGGPAGTPTPKDISLPNPATSHTHSLGNKATADDIEMQTRIIPSSSSRSSSSSPQTASARTHRRNHNSRPKPSGNRATSMTFCQMLFALAADKIIFGITIGVWSWIGSGLILGGSIWVATAKDGKPKQKQPRDNLLEETGRMFSNEGDGNGDEDSAGPGKRRTEERVGLLRDEERRQEQDEDEDEDVDEEEVVEFRPTFFGSVSGSGPSSASSSSSSSPSSSLSRNLQIVSPGISPKSLTPQPRE